MAIDLFIFFTGSNLTDPVKRFSLDQLEGTRGSFQTPGIEFPPYTSCDNKLRNYENINNNDFKTVVYLYCLPKTPLNIILVMKICVRNIAILYNIYYIYYIKTNRKTVIKNIRNIDYY